VNQPVYIRSTTCISPQPSFGEPAAQPNPGEQPPVEYTGTRLKCIEPDYKALLDPKLIRRMSRIIRMGTAAALACLRDAGIKEPDAIVTGTAYGCLEDTGLFLTSVIERNEEMLQPATFIQSTHNTVGAQIALMLQCTGYNNTFVHRGFSFESALLDAALLLADEEATSVLAGGIDELTATSYALLSRFGLYRHTIAGEGAAFFLLAARPSENDYARLDGMTTFCRPADTREVKQELLSFLTAHDINPDRIDLVIAGNNGDSEGDDIYRQLSSSLFHKTPVIPYKHLCGEYPTSTAFALWMAANQVRSGAGRILIYNHYLGIYHTAFLLSPAKTR
jgi:3-oxoacyl-(acyl-carrier-protein) synthase